MTTSAGNSVGQFFRSSAVYAVGNALGRVGSFLLLPIYTRHLSVAQYGELELLYVIAAIATGFLSVGIAHATLRFYFEYPEQEDRNAVVSTNLVASFVISALGAVAIASRAEDLAALLFGDKSLALGVWIVLATLVFELSSQVALAYVRAREQAMLFVAVALGKLVVQVAVNTWLLVVLEAGVVGVLTGNLVTVVAGWLVLVGFTVRHVGLRFSWAKLKPVLKYGYPFLLTTMVALVAANVDRLLITGLISLQALGLYALATKFSALLSELIGEPFNQAYGAFRFKIMGQPDAGEIQARVVRYLLVASCFGALGLVYFVEPVLRVMSDPAFHGAATLVPILAAAAVARILTYPAQTGILYRKETRRIFHIAVAGTIASTTGGYVLVTRLGLTGACLGVLTAAVLTLGLTQYFSQRCFPVRYEYGRLARVVIVTVAFHFAAEVLPPAGAWEALAFRCGLLALFLLAVVAAGGVTRQEVGRLRAWMRTLSQRAAHRAPGA